MGHGINCDYSDTDHNKVLVSVNLTVPLKNHIVKNGLHHSQAAY